MEDVELTVAEAVQTDVGQGKARIDAQTRVELDLSPGDIIRIEGKSVSAAVVWRMLSEDENKGIIRIDGLVRKNVSSSLGDHVKVTRADVKPALLLKSCSVLSVCLPSSSRSASAQGEPLRAVSSFVT